MLELKNKETLIFRFKVWLPSCYGPAPPSTTKGIELHHLKETKGKLWNWKINNNNEIHMLHHFLSLQSSTHVASCKRYFIVFSYNDKSSAGFCFTSLTPKSQHYSWHCTRIQGSSACIIRKCNFQFIQSWHFLNLK